MHASRCEFRTVSPETQLIQLEVWKRVRRVVGHMMRWRPLEVREDTVSATLLLMYRRGKMRSDLTYRAVRHLVLDVIEKEGRETRATFGMSEAVAIREDREGAEENEASVKELFIRASLSRAERMVMRNIYYERRTVARVASEMHLAKEKVEELRVTLLTKLRAASRKKEEEDWGEIVQELCNIRFPSPLTNEELTELFHQVHVAYKKILSDRNKKE